ncbi:hypothetical protein CSC82_03800 [Rhodobacteraceae bacterium 4F10]|nr:hypothetical protein CSC82_03800 [Rhodobacteraceae bacterium 4F10]
MKLLIKLRKLWFPDAETRKKLDGIAGAYKAKIASAQDILSEFEASKAAAEKELHKANSIYELRSKRLRDLDNCFDDKSELYDELNDLHKQMRSIKSELDDAYRDLKKNKAKKEDFYDWSKRQRSLWNGYTGRGGRKVRNHWNIKSVFDKYSRQDLDRYKSNIDSAKRRIGQNKSKRDKKYSEIQKTKRMIGEAKELCAYVKSPEGKKEKRDLRKKISAQKMIVDRLRIALTYEQGRSAQQQTAIVKIRREWTDDSRKIKLAK